MYFSNNRLYPKRPGKAEPYGVLEAILFQDLHEYQDNHEDLDEALRDPVNSPCSVIETDCLGLSCGHARVLSLLIANQYWDRSLDIIKSIPLDQDTLDEALLACAMNATLDLPRQHKIRQGHLALDLIAKGANPDRWHYFCRPALHMIDNSYAKAWDPTLGSGGLTARHWAIAGSLLIEQDGVRALEQAFITSLPKFSLGHHSNGADHEEASPRQLTWSEWAMHLPRQSAGSGEDRGMSEVLTRLIESENPPLDVVSRLLVQSLDQRKLDDWRAFDGIANSAPFSLLSKSFLRQAILDMVIDERLNGRDQFHQRHTLWLHPRLDHLVSLMKNEDQLLWSTSFGTWINEVRATHAQKERTPPGLFTMSEIQKEALDLAFSASVEAFSNGVSHIRPRRTL